MKKNLYRHSRGSPAAMATPIDRGLQGSPLPPLSSDQPGCNKSFMDFNPRYFPVAVFPGPADIIPSPYQTVRYRKKPHPRRLPPDDIGQAPPAERDGRRDFCSSPAVVAIEPVIVGTGPACLFAQAVRTTGIFSLVVHRGSADDAIGATAQCLMEKF
jgi:hypothetical protein